MKDLYGKYDDDSCIIIHDGIRPLLDISVLNDVITVCKKFGNAVTALPYNEQIFVISDEKSTNKYIPRESLRRVATPQAYKLGKLYQAYLKAMDLNIFDKQSSYTNTMFADLGETLYFAKGSDRNIKLTTKDDLEIFRSYVSNEKIDWIK